MTKTVLILGAGGRFGRNAAEAFWNAGWQVTLFDRKTDDLMQAAQGVDVIVNGWNPSYPDWAAQLPGLTRAVIAAAEASGATILQPANVYVFGAEAPERFSVDTPRRATNPLGRLRIEMEAALAASSARVILLRAGDFLDTEASGNWFDKQMAPPVAKGRLVYPGPTDVPHAWAFLPDMARAAVMLAERRDALPRFAEIPFPGYTLTGQALAGLCGRATGKPVKARRMSWLPLWLARPFWRMAAPLIEMRYLWRKPHHVASDVFQAWLPDFAPTSPQDAVARALEPVVPEARPRQPTAADAARPPATPA